MADPSLQIATDLALPVDAVTETFLIFGRKGSGKTATAGVLAEEMITAGLQVAVLDPMDAWWGLRSSADGQGPGLPVLILGGEHGDLPLHPGSGARVADMVVDERLPVVLSLFLMSKTQQRTFVCDFMERLFLRNREPMHLVIDEADRWAPQRGNPEGARLLGAYEDIVLRGRRLGIGSTSITLRVAQLNSAIRSQVEVLVAMRMLGKLDVQAIDEWIRLHADEGDARDLKASLPSLPTGTAWFWSPGGLDLLKKVQVRPRHTFDSSATPKVGQQRIVPRAFARVDAADLERLGARLGREGAPVEGTPPGRAASGDVKRLRAEVTDLRARLATAENRAAERVEVPILAPGEVAVLEQAIAALRDVATGLEASLRLAVRPPPERSPAAAAPLRPIPAPRAERTAAEPPDDGPKLRTGARNMLTVLARQHPVKVTRRQLATLAKLKVTGGTFGTYFGDLRRAGLIAEHDGFVVLTDAGFAYTGASPDLPVTADELRETWRDALRTGARKMLDILLDRYPQPVTRGELAELTELEQTGGTFGTYLGDLRRNGLADEADDGIRAAEVFFLGSADA